jgi:hypothetical protein
MIIVDLDLHPGRSKPLGDYVLSEVTVQKQDGLFRPRSEAHI